MLVRRWRGSFLRVTLAVAAVSFALNIFLIGHETVGFYFSVSRFWELMAGGGLAYLAAHRPALLARHGDARAVLGLLLIAIGMAAISNRSDFPGWWALLPVAGAFLTISAGGGAWLNRRLLSHRWLVWVGLVSYPLYLWHWPLLTLLRMLLVEVTPLQTAGAVLAAFVLAGLTRRFVETPFRSGERGTLKAVGLSLAMLLLLIAGLIVSQSDAVQRIPRFADQPNQYVAWFENDYPEQPYFRSTGLPQAYRHDCDFYDHDSERLGHVTRVPVPRIAASCYTREPSRPHAVLLWGDSHAQMLYAGVSGNLPANWQVLVNASASCIPDTDAPGPSDSEFCRQSNWFALQTIARTRPDVVVVAQNIGHSAARMARIAAKLRGLGVGKIIFTGPAPHWNPVLYRLITRQLWVDTPHRSRLGVNREIFEAEQRLKADFRPAPGVVYVSLMDFFCNSQGCMTYIGDDRRLGVTTFDYGHLTPVASDLLGRERLAPEIVAKP